MTFWEYVDLGWLVLLILEIGRIVHERRAAKRKHRAWLESIARDCGIEAAAGESTLSLAGRLFAALSEATRSR